MEKVFLVQHKTKSSSANRAGKSGEISVKCAMAPIKLNKNIDWLARPHILSLLGGLAVVLPLPHAPM